MKLIFETNKFNRVKKALFGDNSNKVRTFALMSVENPLGWKNSDTDEFQLKYRDWLKNKYSYNKKQIIDINTELHLKQINRSGEETLKYGSFSYVKLWGTYKGDVEKSVMVFNIPYIDAEEIARSFGQESFFFGIVNNGSSDISYYETIDSCKSYSKIGTTSNVILTDEYDDVFSKYGFRFKIDMDSIYSQLPEIANDQELEESFDKDRTFKSRALHRRHAYQKG